MSNENENEVIKVGKHEFILKYLKRPTWCGICNEFIVGVTLSQQNSYKCLCCKLIGHYNCLSNAPIECIKKKVEFNDNSTHSVHSNSSVQSNNSNNSNTTTPNNIKGIGFSDVTDAAMKTYLGSSAQRAGHVRNCYHHNYYYLESLLFHLLTISLTHFFNYYRHFKELINMKF